MSLFKASIVPMLALLITICASSAYADLLVQLNVNRPLNDVNEKFVSFTVDPSDLYHALDGSNRKTLTQMATMLGTSYVKFSDDYNFIPDTDTKYRNPTKTIWKGFNRWTSAVNWTMIMPLPYEAGEWDPMESLRILNTSYTTGITDCIWQLGTEFGTSVAEYFNDLNTLSLMVDTFGPYVDDWEVTGAEMPSGSTNEDIRRYIEYSKDMNTAFNWLQPADASTSNAMFGTVYESDRVLRAMFNEKVPVWLNFMPKERTNKSKRGSSGVISGSETTEDITEVLRWAQTLGEAASSGFDAVFRRMELHDLERPSQSFFTTLVFKKVMGSRVFPARPFTIFLRSNKLYTHCANTVSGGIAFMIVNPDDESKQISIRSATKISGDEYWQYILTFKKNHAYLNNEKLTLNSTLPPQIKTKSPNKSIQLNSPGKSIGFWVLPTADLEHCQFTEIDVDELERDSEEEKARHKQVSSSDKLLQQLIQETALPDDAMMRNNHRGRRYATRARHVVLKDKDEHMESLAKLFEPLSLEEKSPKKREEAIEDRRTATLKWIKDLLDTAMQDGDDLFSLKRNTRSVDDYFGAIFGTKGAQKRSPIVKKITEIRKPEKKSIKPAYDPEHFNEEEFFNKMGTEDEPELPRVPEGDVHLTHITNVEGEDANESKERGQKKLATMKIQGTIGKETRNEMKPVRLLPTEFYEAMPVRSSEQSQFMKPHKWNALLFPEPFTKKSIISDKKLKSNTLGESTDFHDADADVEKVHTAQFQSGGQLAEDFLRAQEELARTFLRDHEDKEHVEKSNKKELNERHAESEDVMLEKIKSLRSKYIDYLAENLENYFNERGIVGTLDMQKSLERTTAPSTTEAPWWNLSSLRKRRSPRALRYQMPDDAWLTNMITKDEELLPLGSIMPERSVDNERVARVSNHLPMHDEISNKKYNGYIRTVKDKVNKVVDIVTKHVSEWYNTFTKPVDDAQDDESNGNRLKITRGKRRY
ncbi:uncharacterized protein LOC105231751 [Bactrocera dorsalis]|uniref:Uncharacterized protein LOC105231751 n=1 Tax=Bactrocera dorsalis TaxID=27457 RepID=A0A6I9W3U4_BACDO|nr:uncharacterized protein LOC105231751 [Bactrocera dorsalis]